MRDYIVRFWVRYVNRVQDTTKLDTLYNSGGLSDEEYNEILSQADI